MKSIWRRINKPIVIFFPFMVYRAMAVWPFIFIKEKKLADDLVLLNHEKIHHRQQLQWFIIPFYVAYMCCYFFNLIKFKNHDKAYRNIPFEKEAFDHETDLNFLKG